MGEGGGGGGGGGGGRGGGGGGGGRRRGRRRGEGEHRVDGKVAEMMHFHFPSTIEHSPVPLLVLISSRAGSCIPCSPMCALTILLTMQTHLHNKLTLKQRNHLQRLGPRLNEHPIVLPCNAGNSRAQ